ncbi:hypothetical protein ACTXT7_009772 [Hymenolepis weldensis]
MDATEGPCTISQPGFLQNAWKELGNLSVKEAMQQYVQKVTELAPDWINKASNQVSGPRVSRPMFAEENPSGDTRDQKSTPLIEIVKDGKLGPVVEYIQKNPLAVHERDMNAKHRNLEIARFLKVATSFACKVRRELNENNRDEKSIVTADHSEHLSLSEECMAWHDGRKSCRGRQFMSTKTTLENRLMRAKGLLNKWKHPEEQECLWIKMSIQEMIGDYVGADFMEFQLLCMRTKFLAQMMVFGVGLRVNADAAAYVETFQTIVVEPWIERKFNKHLHNTKSFLMEAIGRTVEGINKDGLMKACRRFRT